MKRSETREQIREILDDLIPDGHDFTVTEVAEKAYLYLLEKEEVLLVTWMDEMLKEWLADYIRQQLSSRRTRWRAIARSRSFKEAAEDYQERKDPDVFRPFLRTFVVDEQNTRRSVGEMTGKDHKFVAESYGRRANTFLMEQSFHEALAKKVGNRRTSEVISEEDYMRLYSSITNRGKR